MGLERPVKGSKMCTQLNSRQLIEESLNIRYSDGIREALGQVHFNFVITDPCLLDHPIVYASQGFLKMSGYSTEEVVGRNVRFLQGPDTDRRTVLTIREAIREEKSCQVSILNYKKNGTAFWNLFHLAPVFSEGDGRVIHFVGVQTPISKFSRSSVSNNVSCSRPNNCPAFVENMLFNHHTSSAIYFGSCRRELFSNFSVDLGHSGLYNSLAEEDNAGLEEEPTCEAKESDKQKAIAAATRILFELTQFSKHTELTPTYLTCPLCMQAICFYN
uniref:PAS domain-containing protein n=1 Tax=Picea sitchensis TaxID=3332 RepID=B8LM24_PICSI|nr:unknown [Picea sitchensis]